MCIARLLFLELGEQQRRGRVFLRGQRLNAANGNSASSFQAA
jgi:hypothetical protein